MTRTWTQLTHAHNHYARSRTTPVRDQASGRACDRFIPNSRSRRRAPRKVVSRPRSNQNLGHRLSPSSSPSLLSPSTTSVDECRHRRGHVPPSHCSLARASTSCIGRHAVQALMATGRTFCAQQAIARLRELSRLRIGPMVVSCFSFFRLNSMLQNLPNFVQI
jgi:hypothetical protein